MLRNSEMLHTCPICGKADLPALPADSVGARDKVVCANEYYFHIARGRRHYFVRTVQTIEAEPIIITHFESCR
jgi:hypothetical protein